jgi:hypothetical protein|tara:strand:- start:33816 stop:34985 length:1170 start_codon:yes stop_codon:yes gene_type:complete
MAKKIINIGEEANDGTGDPIRTAMSKTNDNFDELYEIGLLSLPDSPISDGSPGMFLQTDGSGNFSFTSGSGDFLTDVVQDTSPQLGGNLDGQTFDINTFGTVSANNFATVSTLDVGTSAQIGTTLNGHTLPPGTGGTYALLSDITGGAYGDADVDTHLNSAVAPATGYILSWSGTDYEWVEQAGSGASYTDADAISAVTGADLDMGGNKVLFGNVYSLLSDLPDASTYHGMFAHVHSTGKAYFAHSGSWQELANAGAGGGGSSLQSRTVANGTTASIANGVATYLDITGFKTYSLLSITTSHAAWVTIYANGASRVADATRTEFTDPLPDAGVIAEVITTGAETVIVSPGITGFNLESTPTTNIPVKVESKASGSNAIAVSLNILQLEA